MICEVVAELAGDIQHARPLRVSADYVVTCHNLLMIMAKALSRVTPLYRFIHHGFREASREASVWPVASYSVAGLRA